MFTDVVKGGGDAAQEETWSCPNIYVPIINVFLCSWFVRYENHSVFIYIHTESQLFWTWGCDGFVPTG